MELSVVQKAILIPSEDLFVPVGAIIDFGVVIVKQSGTEGEFPFRIIYSDYFSRQIAFSPI